MNEAFAEARHSGSVWVDEKIWGHRLHDQQSPWLTFLEFLTVFRALRHEALSKHRAPHEPLSYRPQQQIRLRHILFNNPHFVELKEQRGLSSDEAWRLWRLRMADCIASDGVSRVDFNYLPERFESFHDFVRTVEYLRRTAVEMRDNKRWTTRFVFPFGAQALYEDVSEPKLNRPFGPDRNFFARSGEVLYLMLSRAARSRELATALDRLFFQEPSASEALVGVLQGPAEIAGADRSGAYLPHTSRPEFDRLADDWLALLNRGMPGLDVVPHLVTIGSLHIWRYFLNLASEQLEQPPPRVLIEMVAAQRTSIRSLSVDNFDENNGLSWRAVKSLLESVRRLPEWELFSAGVDGRSDLLDHLAREYSWPDREARDTYLAMPVDEILDELIDTTQSRHQKHIGKIHAMWARDIGLASRRSSRRVRYAPNDRLLKTLVLTHVPQRLEFKTFLALLHERYGFVIGDHEGSAWIEARVADKQEFKRNAQRLEERLSSLGLAERLSDACAYVLSAGGLGA